jgi:hypothetical protein
MPPTILSFHSFSRTKWRISYEPAHGGGYTPSATYTTGDINEDGTVDIFDFNTLMVNWGDSPANSAADLDGNGVVDIFDFNLLMVNWG